MKLYNVCMQVFLCTRRGTVLFAARQLCDQLYSNPKHLVMFKQLSLILAELPFYKTQNLFIGIKTNFLFTNSSLTSEIQPTETECLSTRSTF